MSASTQLASASTMDRLSLYMGTCCRIWIGLYLALCCLTSVTSLMLHVAAVGLLLCILSYFRLPAPEPGEVFRILGKLFLSTYLWGILDQWDIFLLNFTAIGFRTFLGASSLTFPFLQMLML